MDIVARKKQLTSDFIGIYNRLDDTMKIELQKHQHVPFPSLLEEMALVNDIVKNNLSFLRNMGNLRNIVSHTKNRSGIGAAIPTEETVSRFQTLVDLIKNPPKLITKSATEIDIYTLGKTLAAVLIEMKDNDYSQLVIKNEDGVHQLITREGITKWLEHSIEEDIFSIKETQIADIIVFEDKNALEFVTRDTDIFEGLKIFASPKKRIQALIITENGKNTEAPLGLITAYDITKITTDLGDKV